MWSLIGGLALAACALPAAGPPSSPTAAATATPEPTPTPTPVPSLLVMEISAEGSLGQSLRTWAEARGWAAEFPTIAEAAPNSPGVQAVVAGDGAAGRIDLQGYPLPVVWIDVRVEPESRTSVVGGDAARRDQAAFVAGAMAGLASRTGAVGLVEGTGGEYDAVYAQGFVHGLRYGCARCLLERYSTEGLTPQVILGDWVDVVFIVPGEAGAGLAAPFTEAGLWLVWAGEEPEGAAAERVAGGVGFDPEALVVLALEDLLAGADGRVWPYEAAHRGLELVDVNPGAVSPGRQLLLEAALQALGSGELETGVDPATGAAW